MSTFEAAIKQRVSDEAPNEVYELILDELKLRDLSAEDGSMLSKFTELCVLSCNRTGLTDLKNLPVLPSVESLELTDNLLNESSNLDKLAEFKGLRKLLLSGNRIKDIKALKFLTELPSLVCLDLELNPLTEINPEYRKELFAALPSLKVIDSQDKNGAECELPESDEDDDDEVEMEENKKILREFYEKDEVSDDDDEEDEYKPGLEENEEESDDDDEEENGDDDAEEVEEEDLSHLSKTEITDGKRGSRPPGTKAVEGGDGGEEMRDEGAGASSC